jgi:excinuclease ABC subunit A
MAVPESLTGQYMSGKRKIEVPKQRVPADPEKVLKLTGARGNNLKDVTLTLPVGCLPASPASPVRVNRR